MSQTPVPAAMASFDARDALRRFAVIGACCAAQLAAVLLTGHGLPCPFRVMTGWSCPLCGCTTAGVQLLRGQWSAAWQSNPFALLLGTGLLVCVACWSVEALGGPATRLPRWLPLVSLDRVLLLLGGPALCWMVWRNLA